MNLEDQVAPLALAMRMKELGFPQRTAFGWFIDIARGAEVPGSEKVRAQPTESIATVVQFVHYDGAPEQLPTHKDFVPSSTWWPPRLLCAAPTVAEMGEWMPAGDSTVRRADGSWTTGRNIKRADKRGLPGSRSEAESRARLLIAAAAHKRIDPAQLAIT